MQKNWYRDLFFQFYTSVTNNTNVWKLNVEATLKPKKPCQCFIERRKSLFIGSVRSITIVSTNSVAGGYLYIKINLIIEGLLKLEKKSRMEKTI